MSMSDDGLLMSSIATCLVGDGRRAPKHCELDAMGMLRLRESRGAKVQHALPMGSYVLRLPRSRSPGGGPPVMTLTPVAGIGAGGRCKLLQLQPNDAKNEWGDWEAALRSVCSSAVFTD